MSENKTCDVQGCDNESSNFVDVVAYVNSVKVDSRVWLCHEHYSDLQGDQGNTSIGFVP